MSEAAHIGNSNTSSTERIEATALDCANSKAIKTEEAHRSLEALILKASKLWIAANKKPAAQSAAKTGRNCAKKPSVHGINKTSQKIIECLSRHGSLAPAGIAQGCDTSLPTTQRHLRKLVSIGLVTNSGKTRNARYALPKT